MRRRASGLFTSIVIFTVTACGGDREAAPEEFDEADTMVETGSATAPVPAPIATEYAPGLNINLDDMERTASGLYVRDVRDGEGVAAAKDDTVVVHYTGWLPNGTKFDSSRERGEPFSFVLGEGRVIPGWEEGVTGLRVGGQRRLVIPPNLGYGPIGAGDVIPPDATLVFEVELLEVR